MTAIAELMRSYCDGDASAFRELYCEIAPGVYAALARMTGSAELARELLEQTFLTFHHSRHAYVRGTDPLPWIQAIAQRTFIDRRGADVRRYAG